MIGWFGLVLNLEPCMCMHLQEVPCLLIHDALCLLRTSPGPPSTLNRSLSENPFPETLVLETSSSKIEAALARREEGGFKGRQIPIWIRMCSLPDLRALSATYSLGEMVRLVRSINQLTQSFLGYVWSTLTA